MEQIKKRLSRLETASQNREGVAIIERSDDGFRGCVTLWNGAVYKRLVVYGSTPDEVQQKALALGCSTFIQDFRT